MNKFLFLIFFPFVMSAYGQNVDFSDITASHGSVAEGTISAVSILPDPQKSDYPDCYYTVSVKLNSIVSGKPIPKEILLIVPGFSNYLLNEAFQLNQGEQRRFHIIPFGLLPEKLKTIQQADDLERFELEQFFLVESQSTSKFADPANGLPFAGKFIYRSAFEFPVNPPISQKAAEAKRRFIERDLNEINHRLNQFAGREAEINQQFDKIWLARSKQHTQLPNNIIWGRIDKTFMALPANHTLIPQKIDLLSDDNLIAITNYNEFFEKNGVQFIIHIVPNFYDIAARVMNPEFANYIDYRTAAVAKQLLEANVECIFSSDLLIKNAQRHELMFLYPSNDHPADGAQDIQTDHILERLERFQEQFKSSLNPNDFSIVVKPTIYGQKSLWPEQGDIANHTHGGVVECQTIRYKDKAISFNPNSALMILGNSFIQMPSPDAAAYPSRLAKKLNYIPSVIKRDAYGPLTVIPLLLMKEKEKLLKGKLVAIMPISLNFLIGTAPFIDIKELDRNLLLLDGRELIDIISLGEDGVSVEQTENLLNRVGIASGIKTLWKGLSCKPEYFQLIMPQKNIFHELPEISLPIDDEKETVLEIDLYSLPSRRNILKVNGRTHVLPIITRWDATYKFICLLPPKSKKLEWSISSANDNSSVLIRNIRVYQ